MINNEPIELLNWARHAQLEIGSEARFELEPKHATNL